MSAATIHQFHNAVAVTGGKHMGNTATVSAFRAEPHFEAVVVTPAAAAKWLGSNTNNRGLSASRVEAYANEMRAGRWILNSQGIAFGADGVLLDGQHRLAAVVAANIPVWMLVVTGLASSARTTIDKLRPRRLADDVKMELGIDRANVALARVNAVATALGNTCRAQLVTFGQASEMIATWRPELEWSLRAFAGARRLGTAPIVGGFMIAYRKFPALVEAFAAKYRTGENLMASDPEAALRNWALMRYAHRDSSLIQTRKTMSAIAARLDGRPVQRLHDNDTVLSRFI